MKKEEIVFICNIKLLVVNALYCVKFFLTVLIFSDQKILKLLRSYEKNGISFTEFK